MGKKELRVFGGLVLGALSALTITACSDFGPAEHLSDGRPVPEPISDVRFDVAAGEVRIRVEPGAPVSFRREIDYHGNRPGSTHRIEGRSLVLAGCGADCSVDYQLVLPERMPVVGLTSSGLVDVSGAASVDLQTSSGRVNLRDVAGPAKVEAKSGDVDLTMGQPAGVTVRSDSGTVVLAVPQGPYRVSTEVDSGKSDVSIPSDPAAPNLLDVRSKSGDVTIRPA
ncbi:DUF4097 family beta strand repeat-containing protein [Amycolatopsis nigrescens]|uniref:DUF4097 family beta strand repeat-containing protein n=1 Tax=Amycolatopsis nigrescens TaxID=381445 RepID=UPI00036D69AE|nr:DUF4097 family beta strand repeat-containing protein [Amycolatopsis nigrescens]